MNPNPTYVLLIFYAIKRENIWEHYYTLKISI